MTSRRRLPAPLALLALLLLLVTGASGAGAQDAPTGDPSQPQVVESWAVAPAGSDDPSQPGNRPYLSYSAAAGSTVTDAITVYNYSNVPLTFRIYASDAFNTEDGSFDVLPGDQDPIDVGSWVALPQENLTIPAGQQATLPISIAIPADATPGDHVGAIIASSRAEGTGADGKVIALDRRTGTRLYLRVDGPVEPNLLVEDIRPSYDPSLNPLGGKATVTYTVANRGNVRLGGSTYVTAAGPFGLMEARSADQELPELLPGEEVTFTVELDGVPAGVLDTATVHIDPAPVAGDADTLEATSQSAQTLAVPWSVLALLVVAGLAVFAWRRFRRHGGTGPTGPAPTAGPGPSVARARERQPA